MTRRDVCDGVDSLLLPSREDLLRFLLSTRSTTLHEQYRAVRGRERGNRSQEMGVLGLGCWGTMTWTENRQKQLDCKDIHRALRPCSRKPSAHCPLRRVFAVPFPA